MIYPVCAVRPASDSVVAYVLLSVTSCGQGCPNMQNCELQGSEAPHLALLQRFDLRLQLSDVLLHRGALLPLPLPGDEASN